MQHMKKTALFASLCSLLSFGPAKADEPATASVLPNKSSYTLFNPTPADQMRSFCTDRPTRSNLPCTVDAGHFQYEADAFNWTYSRSGGVTQNTFLYTNPTLKLGLTNTSDFELNIAPAQRVKTRGPGVNSDLIGVGDLFLRLKQNIAGPEGGDFQATILPFVKVPTAKPGIGNKAVEGGMIVPVSFALPNDFTLLFDPEIDFLRNAVNRGRHANFQMLANLSRTIVENVTGYAEVWTDINNDPLRTTHQASLDLAVSWVAWANLPNLQLDAGVNIGVTRDTPKIQAYAGISQRF
jgi:Putative MetA-pathway of phenol degradation